MTTHPMVYRAKLPLFLSACAVVIVAAAFGLAGPGRAFMPHPAASFNTAPVTAYQASGGAPNFVRVSGQNLTLNGQPITIKGANYYPTFAPWAGMWTQWDGVQVQKELTAAQQLDINAIRILVPYDQRFSWTDGYGHVNPVFLNELQQTVQIAGQLRMRVLVTLFDWYGDFDSHDPRETVKEQTYLRELITPFVNDDRVLGWDIHNEPDNYDGWKDYNNVMDWLAWATAQVRALDPNHPVTIGMAHYAEYWHADGKGRTPLDFVDFVSLHLYESPNLQSQMHETRAHTGKPIFIEETGWPTGPSSVQPSYNPTEQNSFYQLLVSAMRAEGVVGATAWLLYDLVPDQSDPDNYVNNMGLLNVDGTPKAAVGYYNAWSGSNLAANVTSNLPLTSQPRNPFNNAPQCFDATGHCIKNWFKKYWQQLGGLHTFGYPISKQFFESSGHLVQYFERAKFEYNGAAQRDFSFGQLPPDEQLKRVVTETKLGTLLAQERGLSFPPIDPFTSTPDRTYFPQTGHSLSGGFKTLWEQSGGEAIFGLPISQEFTETTANGTYTVQYFERARMEYHPEWASTDWGLALGLLGREYTDLHPIPPAGQVKG